MHNIMISPQPLPVAAGGRRAQAGGRTYRADELDLDARVFQSLAILWPHCDCTLDRFTIHVQRGLLAAVLVQLHVDHCALVGILQDDVDVDGRREEVRHVTGAP